MNKKSGTDSKSAPNHKIPLIKFYLCLCPGFILSLNHESRGMNLDDKTTTSLCKFNFFLIIYLLKNVDHLP